MVQLWGRIFQYLHICLGKTLRNETPEPVLHRAVPARCLTLGLVLPVSDGCGLKCQISYAGWGLCLCPVLLSGTGAEQGGSPHRAGARPCRPPTSCAHAGSVQPGGRGDVATKGRAPQSALPETYLLCLSATALTCQKSDRGFLF